LSTSGYGGETMRKGARVESNDPKRPAVDLSIGGEVLRFVTIQPGRLVFQGDGQKPMRQKVTIVPEARFAFKLLKVETNAGKRFIEQRLEEIRHNGEPAYRLIVENRRTEPGRYAETLTLHTDSPIRPKLFIHVYGNILPPKQDKAGEPS
jgi:hypothetical protein